MVDLPACRYQPHVRAGRICRFGDGITGQTEGLLFEEQEKPLVAQGIDVLIPGGGISMLLFSNFYNHTIDPAPVINGIPIAVKMTEMTVSLKQHTGQNVSRTGDYAKAPDHVIDEFLSNPMGL